MRNVLKNITVTAMGIALFVVLSMCLQIPVFENYYLCLGYVAMTVYCYIVGTTSGTLVGTIGVFLYCLLICGLRGMPGWVAGNLILGIVMGLTFKVTKRLEKPVLELIISAIVIIITTAFAMLIVKSVVEYLIYSEPFILRVIKNVYAFVADAFVIVVSIPIARLLEPKFNSIINNKN